MGRHYQESRPEANPALAAGVPPIVDQSIAIFSGRIGSKIAFTRSNFYASHCSGVLLSPSLTIRWELQ